VIVIIDDYIVIITQWTKTRPVCL